MARIRSIKPEFPQSESMGRISRDARLLFIELWTIADDEGRLRGNSRMLASLLFPYDDDANLLIEAWLGELVDEHCIIRYAIEKDHYIQICNWLIHQKIDKPSKSKIPAFDESSRILANPREVSSEDQGSKDQGSKDQGGESGDPQADAQLKGKNKTKTFSPDDLALAELIAEKVSKLTNSKKPPNLKSWANEIRLMRESDQRTLNEIRSVFLWANQDSFWKSNILSPSSLRKNFDRLVAKMNSVVVPISAKNW